MPKQDISLLPQELKEKRVEEVRLDRLKKVGFAFLFLSLVAALGAFLYSQTLNSSLSQTNQNIKGLEQKIDSLQSVEEAAFDVEQRSAALRALFEKEVYFSYLLKALGEATTADVEILELSAPSAETVSISGSARSYTSLAKFLLALNSSSTPGSLFSVVALKEVSLDRQTGKAQFNVNLSLTEGVLSAHE